MSRIISIQATPTITAGAYSSGDAVGGLLTFSNAAGSGSGKVQTIGIVDKGDQKVALDLILYRSSATATADNDPISISAADALKVIGVVSIVAGDYSDLGSISIATKRDVQLSYRGGTDCNLYGQLVARGTPTYASTSDLIVQLVIENGDLNAS